MDNETLIEREAERKSGINKSSFENTESELLLEFNLDIRNSKIKYKNMDEESNILCSIKKLTTSTFDEVIKDTDLIISEEVLNELRKLHNKLQLSWDDELSMYKVSYRENCDGSSELYIPLDTDYTDDFIVEKIYDENNEFVSNKVEEQIDFPMYKLETRDLYIESIRDSKYNPTDVYTTQEKTLNDVIKQSSNPLDNLKQYRTTILVLFAGSLVMNVLPVATYIFGSTEAAIFTYGIMNLFMLMPITLPLALLVILITFVECYNQFRKQDVEKKCLFETTHIKY